MYFIYAEDQETNSFTSVVIWHIICACCHARAGMNSSPCFSHPECAVVAFQLRPYRRTCRTHRAPFDTALHHWNRITAKRLSCPRPGTARMATTAQHVDDAAVMTAEAKDQLLKESTQQCRTVLDARRAMTASDSKRLEELAESLLPSFLCNACKGLLLEPWLVKDCGHLFCFRCLHSMVYEQQVQFIWTSLDHSQSLCFICRAFSQP